MKFSLQGSARVAGLDEGRDDNPSQHDVRDYAAALLQQLTKLAEQSGDGELHRLLEPISREAAKLRQRTG
jgi:hypothetical protein